MRLHASYGEIISNAVLQQRQYFTLFIGVLIFIIFICLAGFYSASVAASSKTPLIVVDEVRTAAIIKQVPLTGTVTSLKSANLSSQVSGQIKILNVDIGDKVNKGDVLLELDSEIEQLTLEAARAATQQAREQLADAKRRFESAKGLEQQNTISIDEIKNRQAEVNIDQAVLKKRIAEEQKQKAIVEHHRIRAPFTGVISNKATEVGEWIEPGKPILTLVATDRLRVDFQVPQEFFTNLDSNSRVLITLAAVPGLKYETKIDAVVPISDPTARTFLMRALIKNDDLNVIPGMSVNGSLNLNTGNRGVVISRDAILRYPDGRITAWVVKLDSEVPKVYERPVKLGHSFNGKVAIIEGLTAGEIVVVQGNESLQEGQQVQIHETR